MAMNVIEETACLNCGQTLTGPYCAGCGQKKSPTDLTLGEFIHEITHELANWDGKIPSTLKTLFLRPGVLTLEFFAGRRARWLLPLRLYLICSIAYFLSGPVVEAITHREAREIAKITVTNDDGSTSLTPETRKELEDGLPARVFGVERLERAAADPRRLNREIDTVMPKAMFLLLPMFAVFTRLAWRRQQPRYPAHLYLALHLHAAWFGAMTLLTIVAGFIPSLIVGTIVGLAVFLYVIWYGLMAAHRVFRDSWPITIAKSAAVAVAYSCCMFALSLGLLGYVLMRM
jgi:hypothetical protein